MNKKLLFATLSLAALAACTDNDFESQNQKVAEEISPVQFEIVNGNDALTRASMSGTDNNTISWSARDKDLFTLYHGAVAPAVTGFENAIYTATPVEGSPAVLTTPSMIKAGGAIMVWPADTTFRIKPANNLSVKIPAILEKKTDDNPNGGVANNIPYVSDLITIADRVENEHLGHYNEAGYNRKYPIYMRPMASQLNLNTVYKGTDKIDALVNDPEDHIQPITVESVALLTEDDDAKTKFSTELPVTFTDATGVNIGTSTTTVKANWDAKETKNAWTHITGLDRANPIAKVARLETTCPIDNDNLMKGCKFLILPQKDIPNTGVAKAAIEVNTYYGQVLIAHPDEYPVGYLGKKHTEADYNAAWYRYVSTKIDAATNDENASATTGETINGKTMYKTVAKSPALGMRQTINTFSNYEVPAGYTVSGEYMGVASNRYVNVDLKYLDMSALHIKSDQQLRDVVRVWKELGLSTVTVFLDGDANNQFKISQKTIAKINEINTAAASETTPRSFSVKPCDVAAHKACNEIVITGGGIVPDLAFIVINGTHKADVVLEADKDWSWSTKAVAGKKAVTVAPAATTGINSIINKGTFASNGTATIAIYDNAAPTPAQVSTIPFVNAKGAKWNVTAGDLTVQFNVTNYGTVNIKKGAEYHQDIIGTAATIFTNEALTKPQRFLDLEDPADDVEEIGKVNNAGVFAATGSTALTGVINNYGLIEHGEYPGDAYNKDAKTYITANQMGVGTGNPTFANAFDAETEVTPAINKLGRINLPYSNKDEDNISVNAALSTGFVSVTVASGDAPADKKLNLTVVGDKVNYVIIKGGIETVTEMTAAIKYIEFADEAGTEIAWQAGTSAEPKTATYDGLIVLSPINIKLYTTVKVNKATYLGNKMYVGGTFTNGSAGFNGYYGDTSSEANVKKNYITY